MEDYLYNELTSDIIQAFYKVYNTLGYGFLEKVYENALEIELMSSGFNVEKQKAINVYYDSKLVGEYFADLVVNGKVIIELKTSCFSNFLRGCHAEFISASSSYLNHC